MAAVKMVMWTASFNHNKKLSIISWNLGHATRIPLCQSIQSTKSIRTSKQNDPWQPH